MSAATTTAGVPAEGQTPPPAAAAPTQVATASTKDTTTVAVAAPADPPTQQDGSSRNKNTSATTTTASASSRTHPTTTTVASTPAAAAPVVAAAAAVATRLPTQPAADSHQTTTTTTSSLGGGGGEKGDPPPAQVLLKSTLWECTAGIPRRELKLVVAEADACEAALQSEIALLEGALHSQKSGGNNNNNNKAPVDTAAVQAILDSPFTPMDRCWTLSALLGRVRGALAPPTLLSVQTTTGGNNSSLGSGQTLAQARQLLAMRQQAAYTRTQPSQQLLAVWKRIFSHRLAGVFKKAVKDEDAPGYAARIRFPMDLGLVRKKILARQIKSLADFHLCIGLIAHNCLKYNGRETDYGVVAREFEQMADEVVRQAVLAVATSSGSPTPKAPPPTGVATAPAPTSSETPDGG